ncbi:MAG: lactonase family protein [Planctomycetota bacterium]|nr:lactonase family protein [Planctomycetota bacterium]MDA1214056.1 lactonase family protein [Planctomycetota bacterium]
MSSRLKWKYCRRAVSLALIVLIQIRFASAELSASTVKGLRVFSAGHSFHFFMPPILTDIAKSAGIDDHEFAGLSAIGGSRVIQHWDVADDKNMAKKLLREGKIDVFTMSPIHLSDPGIEHFADLAVEGNPDIRVLVQEFWLPFDIYDTSFTLRPKMVDHNAPTADDLRKLHEPYFESMDEHIAELNKKYPHQVLYIVPVGQAVIALREKIINGEAPGLKLQEDLFTDPIGHASLPLQALVAYCHYAAIYEQSPVGLPIPKYFTHPNFAKLTPQIDEEMNQLLQELAWNAVTEHPQSGVKNKETHVANDNSSSTFIYVSKAPEQEIQIYRRNDDKLTAVDTFAVEGTPGSLGVDPDKHFLYASLRNNNTLGSYRIDPNTGKLTPLNTVELGDGANAAFVGTDRTGKWLLSASYSAGRVVVHKINEDGSIASPAVQSVETAKTAHCIAVSRDNKMVYVPHVAPNAVYQFRFDAETGMLTDAGQAPGGAEGAGPRHLAFHPTENFAYTSDESGSSITAYAIDRSGILTPAQTDSTLPEGYSENNSTAEVKVHPNGKFVWVSNRGHDSLAGFKIADDGKLTPIGQTPTEKTPRSFDIDPSGQFAYGAGEGSGKLAFFTCDPQSGKLTRIETLEVGQSLSWVLAVEIRE